MVDTSRIHGLVAQGRRRLKLQSALETATQAVVLASAVALVVVYAVRMTWISEDGGLVGLAGAVAIVLGGLLYGYLRRFPTTWVATRIDRASGLSDRLASACEFEQRLRAGEKTDPETIEMMQAAVADAMRAVASANVRAATPFAVPGDARPALGFAVVSAFVALLYIRAPEVDPVIAACVPAAAAPGGLVEVRGVRFCGEDPDEDALADGQCADDPGGLAFIGEADTGLQAEVMSWRDRSIELRVPETAAIGKTVIRVRRGDVLSNPIDFEVLDPTDERALPKDAVVLDEDENEFKKELLGELRETAERTQDMHLEEFVNDVEELLEQAEKGQISKQEMLDKMTQLENDYMQGAEENVDEAIDEAKETGEELKKESLTKELGKALEQGDMQKAQEEMEKLAEKMEKGELSEKEMDKVAKALDKAAQKFDEKQDKQDKQLDNQIAQKKQQLERLEKKMEQSKNEREKQELARQKEKEDRELKKLERKKEEREKSEARRSLKSLHRNMKKAAENLQKKDQQQSPQQRQKYASENMRNAKQDTGKVENEQKKVANQKKVASQMSDLKEAMRRAKSKGKGNGDRFGKNGRNEDFRRRARGQKGSGSAWKPGSTGQGKQGQGQGQNGGNGQKGDPSNTYGDGHDPDLMGDPTGKGGHTKDEQVQGVQGREGTSTRETILSAAQKGFSSQSYAKVHAKYKAIVEEVIKTEKVPSGYKYYVKKYFQKIKPHEM